MALLETSVTTTNATQTTLLSQTLDSNAAAYLEIIVIAIDNLGVCSQFDRISRLKRSGGDATSIFDTPKDNQYRESGAGSWQCTLTSTSTGYEVKVTGEAGKTIVWTCEAHIRETAFA